MDILEKLAQSVYINDLSGLARGKKDPIGCPTNVKLYCSKKFLISPLSTFEI